MEGARYLALFVPYPRVHKFSILPLSHHQANVKRVDETLDFCTSFSLFPALCDPSNVIGQTGDFVLYSWYVPPSCYVSHDTLTRPTGSIVYRRTMSSSLCIFLGRHAYTSRKLFHFSVPPQSHGAALILPSEMNDLCLSRAYFCLLPHWFVDGS